MLALWFVVRGSWFVVIVVVVDLIVRKMHCTIFAIQVE